MKIINGLYRTVAATFPRSGNTYMIYCLGHYFSKQRLHFTDIHRPGSLPFDKDPDCVLLKTHDFDLKFSPQPQWKYLVQIRDPLEALASWNQLNIEEGHPAKHIDEWWRKQMQFYADFVKKWILQPMPNRLVVPFAELMADPVAVLSDVITFLNVDATVDLDKLTRVALANQRPYGRQHPTPFIRV